MCVSVCWCAYNCLSVCVCVCLCLCVCLYNDKMYNDKVMGGRTIYVKNKVFVCLWMYMYVCVYILCVCVCVCVDIYTLCVELKKGCFCG